MCKSFTSACLLFLLLGAAYGCKSPDNAQANGEQKQYQAVCLSKEAHEGNEYILTKWLDSKTKAQMYGGEHARKKKGHNVVYRERLKPAS